MLSARCALVCLTLLGLLGKAQSQTPPSSETPAPYLFSTKVDWVILNATVRDRKNWFVPDLTQADFKVYENGFPQTIRLFRHEDIPVFVGLIVDHSASMFPKLAEVVAAAQTFVAASRSDDQMFVINFNDYVGPGTGRSSRATSEGNIKQTHSRQNSSLRCGYHRVISN